MHNLDLYYYLLVLLFLADNTEIDQGYNVLFPSQQRTLSQKTAFAATRQGSPPMADVAPPMEGPEEMETSQCGDEGPAGFESDAEVPREGAATAAMGTTIDGVKVYRSSSLLINLISDKS